MEKSTTITLRVEKDLKKRFYELCEDFGMNATVAFNIFMKAVVRERKIPFEVQSSKIKEDFKAKEAFDEMRRIVAEAGLPEPTLEEINEEIRLVRNERKK